MTHANPFIEKAITEMGFQTFTEIQLKTMPLIEQGLDIIGHSQTGTGKTAAFALPILQGIDPFSPNIQAIILCPTRELAVQVKNAFDTFSKYMPSIKTIAIYGGESIQKQINALKKKPQIIVSTPGRTIDHINRKLVRLDFIKYFVLDEADEMLNMGFKEDIEIILETANKERQTIMFSATMPRPILALSQKYMNDPKHITVVPSDQTNKNISQYVYHVQEKNKIEAIKRLLTVYNPTLSLVFCNTKNKVDQVMELLTKEGYSVDKIHGDLPQTKRLETLNKFHKRQLDILVATDVAARGLDIKNVDAVYNYDVPEKSDYYVHRIGRTGRVDRKGYAFTLATKKDLYTIKDIEKFSQAEITKRELPTLDNVLNIAMQNEFSRIEALITSNKHLQYKSIAKELVKFYDAENVVAALLAKEVTIENSDNINEDFSRNTTTTRGPKGKSNDRNTSNSRRSSSGASVKYSINVGSKLGLTPKKFVSLLQDRTKLKNNHINDVNITYQKSFFSIDKKHVPMIENSLKSIRYEGKPVTIQKAN
ncbi:MAG: DEAD/DEAH box helicase [Candidatus Izemoplasmataceae bacterium]|jgi:ATP-dependent RNA helicase DeaD|uniref:DEAD/DEAH box helicase n=1 Tax=Liberiplasma polymorphum TaxID=3374570 RepID=UPI003770E5E4